MNKKGTIALEALIASGLILLLLTVLASLFIVFWQSWHETTQDNRQRQWAAMAFEYLDRDIRASQKVSVNDSSIRVSNGPYEYRMSSKEDSFHRKYGLNNTYYALAVVDSAVWWWEGELLWVELNFPNESYRCCYYIPEEKR